MFVSYISIFIQKFGVNNYDLALYSNEEMNSAYIMLHLLYQNQSLNANNDSKISPKKQRNPLYFICGRSCFYMPTANIFGID